MSFVTTPELADGAEMLAPAPPVVTFAEWWQNIGSGMPPHRHEDGEEHAKRISEAAWNMAATFGKPMDLSGVTIHEAPAGMVMVPAPAATCVWSHWAYDEWQGSCGARWNLAEEDPAESAMNFCPGCGGLVEVAEEDDE